MRNLDLNSITSLYENKVIARNLVSEAMPPYSAGEMGPETAGTIKHTPEKQKAAMGAQYPAYPRLNPEQMQRAGQMIATSIVDFLGKLPDKTFAHGETNQEEDAAFRKIVGDMIVQQLKLKSGDPVFPKSHAVHVARQLADALIDAKILSYEGRKKGKSAAGGGAAPSKEIDF